MRALPAVLAAAFTFALAPLASGSAAQAQTISIATLPLGSTFNTMGSVIANVARRHANLAMVVQPYGGTAAMMEALENGLAEFSILDVNDVIRASAGKNGPGLKGLRIVTTIRPMQIGFFVRSNSDIVSVQDLRGKRITSGWTAFPMGAVHTEGVLAAVGLKPSDTIGVPVPDLISGADAVASGRADATMFAIGAPKVAELNSTLGGVRFLPLAKDSGLTIPEGAEQRVRDVSPAFYLTKVEPAPPFVGVHNPMQMITWDLALVASSKVPDETVQKLLSAILDNRKEMVTAYPLFAPFSEAAAFKDIPVQYHPGAVKLFKERGIQQKPFT